MSNLFKRIPLLDKGYVELIDLMPHPSTGVSGDLAIVNAARVSFLGESKGPAKDKKLLFYLMKHKHTSPFEQVEFKFRVKAPSMVLAQWIRHRTGHYNVSSGRYTKFENEFYVPTKWRLQSKDNKQGSDGILSSVASQWLTEDLVHYYEQSLEMYNWALTNGVAKELARLFLPGFSVYYSWVFKIDAHNLMHFLKLRRANDAQYEIRVYAEAIYEHFFKLYLPWTAEAYEKYS